MRSVYVMRDGATLRREGSVLQVWAKGQKESDIRVQELEQIVLMGNVILTPAALELVVEQGIDTVFLSRHGRYRGRLVGGVSSNVRLRIAQYRVFTDPDRVLDLARRIVAGKARNQRRVLLRAIRAGGHPDLGRAEISIRAALARLDMCSTLDEVRGCEGSASAAYFRVFGNLIRAEGFRFDGRNRRPPLDPVNALLSLGYTLLANAVEAAIHLVGLDPYLGSLHEIAAGRPSLTCDLVEEHRAPLVDRLVLAAINRGAVRPEDFEDGGPEEAVLVKRECVRWFVTLFERRMERPIFYPPIGKALPYRSVIEQQVLRMARHVLDGEPYVPFEPD